MSEIEKIQNYIKQTPINNRLLNRYDLHVNEWLGISNNLHPIEAISLAFSYGRAKGYRAAKKELKNA